MTILKVDNLNLRQTVEKVCNSMRPDLHYSRDFLVIVVHCSILVKV